jgi:replication-associated recombination protein RarA
MKGIIDEVKASKGQIILFIDEIHNIVAGGEGAGDAGNLLKPALSRGEMQLIGATTLAEYRKYIEKEYSKFEKKVLDSLFKAINYQPDVAEGKRRKTRKRKRGKPRKQMRKSSRRSKK